MIDTWKVRLHNMDPLNHDFAFTQKPERAVPTLPPKGKMSHLQGNRLAVSIFFDKYQNQSAGLETIRGDAESIERVLEDKQKFGYKFPSEPL